MQAMLMSTVCDNMNMILAPFIAYCIWLPIHRRCPVYSVSKQPHTHHYPFLPSTLYLLVFRCVHSSASSLLCRLFCLRANSEARSRTCTRSRVSLGLVLPRASSRFGYSSLSYLAADRWNSVRRSGIGPPCCFTKSISYRNPRLARVPRKETIGLWGLP